MSKIVIALGGNALGATPSEQKEAVKKTAYAIVELYKKGNQIVIVHGNGPQVGWINNSFMQAFKSGVSKEVLPFPESGAMSQGYIGYHIQQAIQDELMAKKIDGNAVALVSQMVVDKGDSAFKDPSKPIGEFMTEEEAKKLASANDWVVKEDAGRGWRRVIASPKPIDLPSLPVLKTLIEKNVITIVGGGGGIPVIKDKTSYKGVDAVIDKDATASFVANSIGADKFIILTAVDYVMINYNKEDEKSLDKVTVGDLEKYIKENQFAPGSMLPKVIAAIDFVKKSTQPAFIGNLNNAGKIVEDKSGTKITI